MKSYETLIKSVVDLPSPPLIVQRLHEVFSTEEISARAIAQVVETDQGFTARVLRLVNSPFYGFRRKIVAVEEAVTMLGYNSIKQLLLTTSLMNTFAKGKYAGTFENFWTHSLGVAIVARHLTYKYNRDTRSEAFICGLLHDVGRLVLMKTDPERFHTFYFELGQVTDLGDEKDFFGIDHQKIGEMLAQKWNFPKSVCQAIANHHTPLLAKEYLFLVAVIHMANIICHALAIGNSPNFYVSQFSLEAWKALKLDYVELEKILVDITKETKNPKEMLRELG